MKFNISKLFIGAAAMTGAILTGCTGDLDQTPRDPNQTSSSDFNANPTEYLAGVAAKCYMGIAVSGQSGPDGASDISGLDGGTSQWSRALFMLDEFTTDESLWIWADVGVFDLVTNTWGSSNANIFGTYSRLYTHIAICNDFLRLAANPGDYGVNLNDSERQLANQLSLEVRALRDLSYYHIIDLFGNAVVAWDDMAYGDIPQQTTRTELYNKVVADLEDVLANFPDATPVYGRIGRDAIEGLLCRFYINAEVYTGTPAYDKCWTHANNIIKRHQGGGFEGSGLANDYLALFCGNNDMFMPGGSLPAQNEILWGIPYNSTYTQPYGGTMFLIAAAIKDFGVDTDPGAGYMNCSYYGLNQNWSCMHARTQFANKFGFAAGVTSDSRAYLWATDRQGFNINNDEFSEFTAGYSPVKFTNLMAEANGTLPRWTDPVSGLPRAGVRPVQATEKFPDTDLPLIRLADIYLMASECALRGAGDAATGLEYANIVRRRAGVTPWNTIEYTLANMIDERSRELYWELVRRTDLIRFGLYTGNGYNWNWKGNVPGGSAIASHMTLFPIPADVVATYGSKYIQNPGY